MPHPPNRLAHEKSPYLLQHANNPVDWRPWGEDAFAAARTGDKPIFLSIGYSTCHWCHVMERESFENEAIADLLNKHFVSIKVDREERPDVDRLYMTFVQATTGSGGWPMSVFLTPDLKPFFGGTYFPPENSYGRPGFRYLLQYLADAWTNERAKVVESGDDMMEQLQKQSAVGSGSEMPTDEAVETGYQMFRRTFDPRLGGFGQAPKFPRPTVHNFLLRYWKQRGNDDALDMVLKTLGEMCTGGMYDQVGGGFHRYSVDERWFVPHFEKMLYDQAQLATSYLEAFQITREERFAEVARDIFDYVCRDLRSPEGAFFSAEDADSVIDPAHPHEKGEGAFYVWTEQEIEEVLGPDGGWFNRAYGVKAGGNVDQDPHHEFTGKNILYQRAAPGVDPSQVTTARQKLLAARSAKRVRPGLDDKILTSWNGLMISAFALAAQVLGDDQYFKIARRAADFILTTLWDGKTLKRRYRAGDAAIDGFLDDYAAFGTALLDIYEAGFDARYLTAAFSIAQVMRERFEDTDQGAFFSSAAGDPSLVLRMKEDYDGAEPGGNSLAIGFLLRLAAMTGDNELQASAERALQAFSNKLGAAPVALPQMLVGYLFWRSTAKQIVIAGEDTSGLLAEVRKRFLPNKVLLRPDAGVSHLKGMVPSDGKATAYVCENFVCQVPVTTPADLAGLLDIAPPGFRVS